MSNDTQLGIAAIGLFQGGDQTENFARMDEFFRIARIPAARTPRPFPRRDDAALPEMYAHDGRSKSVAAFLEETETAALLVLVDGEVVLESYRLTGGPEQQWMSWSMSKSFVSALVGIASADGLIGSIEDLVVDYVPSLRGSAYEHVSLRDVLEMSSGCRWYEDDDIPRMGLAMSYEGTQADVVRSATRHYEPGTAWQYNSCDTHAAGMVLTAATGSTITEFMDERLCSPLGFEDPSYWLVDGEGMEMAGGGLCITARDLAKFGELFRLHGRCGSTQVIPAEWVDASTKPGRSQVEPGSLFDRPPGEEPVLLPYGYGYQWWVPEGGAGEFEAIGIYNQFIHVDRPRGVVVVKLSANRSYGIAPGADQKRQAEHVHFFRAVADAASRA